jgi:hypothetical protein
MLYGSKELPTHPEDGHQKANKEDKAEHGERRVLALRRGAGDTLQVAALKS